MTTKKEADNNAVKKNKATFIPKGIILFAIFLSSVSSPFVGYSYFKAFLKELGFNGSYIDIGTQEAIYQSVMALKQFMLIIYDPPEETNMLLDLSLKSGYISACYAVGAYLIFYFSYLFLQSKQQDKQLPTISFKPFFTWFIQKPKRWLIIKIFPVGITGFTFGFLLNYFVIVMLILVLGTVYGFMMVGVKLGERHATQLINQDICVSKEWPENEAYRVGCNQIYLSEPFKDQHVLVGLRVHQSNNATFFITNEGAYELDSEVKVKFFTQKHKQVKEDKSNIE